jgi:metal transporter CNNM
VEYAIILILLAASALFSGLTLGLMGWDAHELKRKATAGNADAKIIYPLRKRGNLLLTTLLIGNVGVNAIISIFIGSLTTGVLAVIVATMLIVIFGEILPQAVFNRYALELGARVAWLVRGLLFVLYPVAAPVAWTLDKILGDELPTIYSKRELMHLIEDHEDAHESDLDEDEERIIKGALTFSEKKVRDIMTPRTVAHAFPKYQIIGEDLLGEVRESGLSRFPVFDEDMDSIVGILYTSQLIGKDSLGKKVGDIASSEVRFISENESLDDALQMFLKTHKHLCIVRDEFGGMSGVLTLEDVLEEIIRSEIIDERDLHPDMRAFARRHGTKQFTQRSL